MSTHAPLQSVEGAVHCTFAVSVPGEASRLVTPVSARGETVESIICTLLSGFSLVTLPPLLRAQAPRSEAKTRKAWDRLRNSGWTKHERTMSDLRCEERNLPFCTFCPLGRW